MVEVVESSVFVVKWWNGEVIPRMCVRSTLLEVRKLLCATRSFWREFFCLVALSGWQGGSQFDCRSRQRMRLMAEWNWLWGVAFLKWFLQCCVGLVLHSESINAPVEKGRLKFSRCGDRASNQKSYLQLLQPLEKCTLRRKQPCVSKNWSCASQWSSSKIHQQSRKPRGDCCPRVVKRLLQLVHKCIFNIVFSWTQENQQFVQQ